MTKHARLSASSSYRWIKCPGSVKAEENLPDTSNKYALEGTLAHEIAAKILNNEDCTIYDVSEEMQENINIYIDYIYNISRKDLYYPEIMVERQVYFPHIIPGGFGTADAVIIEANHLHIVDFKYGMGDAIIAYENSQLLLYAMGALEGLENKSSIEHVSLHIVQPRINNFDKWSLSIRELKFYEGYIKAKAEEALRKNAPLIPNEIACKWCKASSTCTALANMLTTVVPEEKTTLTDEETKTILDNSKLIKNFLTSLENNVFEKLKLGQNFPGYKLVEGRNIRKLKPDIDDKLFELLGEKAYIKTPVGVTELDKLLDKETLKSLVYFSKTKPLLVSINDKRKALELEELNFDPVIEENILS